MKKSDASIKSDVAIKMAQTVKQSIKKYPSPVNFIKVALYLQMEEILKSVLKLLEMLEEEKKALKEAKKYQRALFNLIIKSEKEKK